MPYNVQIKDEQGRPLAGTIYMYNEQGEEIGQAGISAAGSTLEDSEVEGSYRFRVMSEGYSYYGTSVLYESNVFTLVKKPQTALYVVIAVIGGFALSKVLKLKL